MKCRINHTKCENYERECVLAFPKCKYQSILPGIYKPGTRNISGVFKPTVDRSEEIPRSLPKSATTNPVMSKIYNLEGDLPIAADVSGCSKCGKVFNSTFAFDHHRVGPYTDRRCLTTEEMMELGMAKNRFGRWISETWDTL